MDRVARMSPRTQEILDILQEECAEVIVEVSKCRRFGLDSKHYKTGMVHSQMLEQELGDVLAMIEILSMEGYLDEALFKQDKLDKYTKLRQYSNIFNDQL